MVPKRVKVGDIMMSYVQEGAGDDVVFIGGLAGGNWQSWMGQIPRLVKQYRVLAFDNRGIGETDSPDVPYSVEMMAADTVGLMDAAGVKRAHFICRSMGGCIAQAIADEHPERVRSIAMVCGFARHDPIMERLLEHWRDMVQNYGWEYFARHAQVHFFTDDFFEQNPDAVARAERAAVEVKRTLHGYVRTSKAAASYNGLDRLRNIKAPVLIVAPAEDMVHSLRRAREMAERLPNAELHIVAKTKHGVLAERPETMDVIEDFMRRH